MESLFTLVSVKQYQKLARVVNFYYFSIMQTQHIATGTRYYNVVDV